MLDPKQKKLPEEEKTLRPVALTFVSGPAAGGRRTLLSSVLRNDAVMSSDMGPETIFKVALLLFFVLFCAFCFCLLF